MMYNDLPDSWSLIELGEVCKLKNGFAFKSDSYVDIGIPVIRISDIGEGKVDLSECVKVIPRDLFFDYKVNKGDILVAMSGATTGKFGIYNLDELAFQNQRVGKFQILHEELLSNSFLLYLLYSLKRRILKDAYGGAQPNISSGKIEGMLIPLPPLSEQIRIVSKIDELFSYLNDTISSINTLVGEQISVESSNGKIGLLRQSILKKAFEGKLVPQDPKDISVSALLDQIKVERTKAKPAKKTKTKKVKA
jgi:type I restriction enzyme S subunit